MYMCTMAAHPYIHSHDDYRGICTLVCTCEWCMWFCECNVCGHVCEDVCVCVCVSAPEEMHVGNALLISLGAVCCFGTLLDVRTEM